MLVVNYQSEQKAEEEIRRLLTPYKTRIRSKIVRGSQTELTMEILMKNENMNITDAVSAVQGVNDVTLVQYRGSYEA